VEIIGTAGEAPDKVTVVESVDDVNLLDYQEDEPLFYVTQTTLSLDDVAEITKRLKERYPKIETLPSSSICYATTNRQLALSEITEEADLILVVGDPTSSNSNRLRERALVRGVSAYLINDADEIQSSWLESVKVIGLTAGASTPEDVVQRCIERLFALGVLEKEEVVFIKEDVFFQLPKIV